MNSNRRSLDVRMDPAALWCLWISLSSRMLDMTSIQCSSSRRVRAENLELFQGALAAFDAELAYVAGTSTAGEYMTCHANHLNFLPSRYLSV